MCYAVEVFTIRRGNLQRSAFFDTGLSLQWFYGLGGWDCFVSPKPFRDGEESTAIVLQKCNP
jgi:hypothetical protein